jgi:hypothetical protein
MSAICGISSLVINNYLFGHLKNKKEKNLYKTFKKKSK